MQNFYDALGVTPQASSDTIRLAFRRIAKERHPDTARGSEAAMRRLNEAYETLRDPERRKIYDRALAQPVPRTAHRPAPPPPLDPETFRAQVFSPLDRHVVLALRDIDEALGDLAEDPTDEDMVTAFDLRVEATDKALTKALNRLASVSWPPALNQALGRYRDGLREAVAAVEDLADYSLACDESLLDEGRDRLQRAARLLAGGRRR